MVALLLTVLWCRGAAVSAVCLFVVPLSDLSHRGLHTPYALAAGLRWFPRTCTRSSSLSRSRVVLFPSLRPSLLGYFPAVRQRSSTRGSGALPARFAPLRPLAVTWRFALSCRVHWNSCQPYANAGTFFLVVVFWYPSLRGAPLHSMRPSHSFSRDVLATVSHSQLPYSLPSQ